MNWFNIILNLFELIASVAGFIYWSKAKNYYWRWFPIYLSIIFITEMFGKYALNIKKDLALNAAIYKYWAIPLEFFFFYWLFFKHFKETSINKWPLYSAVIYLVCWLSDIFSWPNFIYLTEVKSLFYSFSYTIGNILLLVLLLIYFSRFIKSDAILKYRSDKMFWVCIGLLLFYVGSMPFYGIRTTLFYHYPQIFYPYWYLQFVLNYLMYLFFTISFIWGKTN